jgi:uncharacterized protein
MKYVLFYESSGDAAAKVPEHYPAHAARAHEFHARGTLLLTGPFHPAPGGGAMSVFTTREAAEEFVRDDPFVTGGVVSDWHIRDWDEAYGSEPNG